MHLRKDRRASPRACDRRRPSTPRAPGRRAAHRAHRRDRPRRPARRAIQSRRSTIISGIPDTRVETTARALAIASRITVGNASTLPSLPTTHGRTSANASRMRCATASVGRPPRSLTTSARPAAAIWRCNGSASSPPPMISHSNSRRRSTSTRHAAIKCSKPFFSINRPTPRRSGRRASEHRRRVKPRQIHAVIHTHELVRASRGRGRELLQKPQIEVGDCRDEGGVAYLPT